MDSIVFKNLIQERFVRRAADLLNAFKSAESIQHGVTRGQIREAALRDSFSPLAPPNLSVYTGFVLDAYGAVTPQLDIIFARHEALSPLLLEGGAALVPIETFAFSVEVKSTLTTTDLNEQIKNQAISLQQMKHTGVVPTPNGNAYKLFQVRTPICVVAYDSKVKIDTLQTFVEKHNALEAVFVITGDKKCSIYRGKPPRTDLNELQLIIQLWNFISYCGIIQNRRPQLSPKDYAQLEEERKKFRPDMPQEWFNELVLTPSLSAYVEPPQPPSESAQSETDI